MGIKYTLVKNSTKSARSKKERPGATSNIVLPLPLPNHFSTFLTSLVAVKSHSRVLGAPLRDFMGFLVSGYQFGVLIGLRGSYWGLGGIWERFALSGVVL